MSEEHFLSIINHWKNQAYELSEQLKVLKNDYQHKLIQFDNENNSIKPSIDSSVIKNEDILKHLLINVDQSSISDQLTVLCHFFVDSLKILLLSKNIQKKETSTIYSYPIIQTIETNIKEIGNIINKITQNSSNV